MIKYLIFLVLLLLHSLPLTGEEDVFYTDSGHAEFTSSVPLHSFTGESDNLTGMIDPQENIVDFYLDLKSLKTGIGRRDRDMFRTLNVDEYPFAEFTGSLDSPFDIESAEEQPVTVSGEFSIHGVTREISIDGILQNRGGDIYLEAEWIINLSDYDIEPPGILFYRVNEEQEVRIEAVLESISRDMLQN